MPRYGTIIGVDRQHFVTLTVMAPLAVPGAGLRGCLVALLRALPLKILYRYS